MTAPNPARQKEGWAKLDRIFADAENVWVIHYSCESFYDRPEGRSPRITSIAFAQAILGPDGIILDPSGGGAPPRPLQ